MTVTQTTTEAQILEWTEQLCEALAENYKRYHLRSMKAMHQERATEYTSNEIKAVEDGTAKLMRFIVKPGKKYLKIIQQDFDTYNDINEYREGSVHAFVDKQTGQIYKPASWKAPAKHVRYDLRDQKSREFVLNPDNCTWAGGWLYMR